MHDVRGEGQAWDEGETANITATAKSREAEEDSCADEKMVVSKGKPVALKKRSTARCLHPSRRPADIQMLSTSTSTRSTLKADEETLTTEFDASQAPQPFLDPDLRDRMLKLRGSKLSPATHSKGQNNE
ncbi:hypothetical protein TRV_04449 [Trichophyton verrucosum HKI 0517]|uniref:Uncharacterized protein n=1 Tax=Trichophyton verrucosum (strain HKI 0517) TaxID=663202 RepID=D4DBE9_TRIVH|nr:uncharacterized protein TRV_04449 [Trichophyton verrucosum HKI 0517]EFE40825.1 hypothetical protein TRV_04449 [Trichophyton verrucosum HKI 0517]